MNSNGNAVIKEYERGQIERQQIQRTVLEWAWRWREGDAQCPRCAGTDFELVDTRADGRLRYETVKCRGANCRASWKVEYRETALAFVEDNVGREDNWVDLHYAPRSVTFTQREAATVLSALRHWRHEELSKNSHERDNVAATDSSESLTSEEIDVLFRRIVAVA